VSLPPAPLAVDLDTTAELPVLDPVAEQPAAAAADADAYHAETWVMPHAVRVRPAPAPDPQAADETRARLETSLGAVHAQLRDTQELLAAKDQRVRQLEDSLQEARVLEQRQLQQLRAGHEELAAALTQQRAEFDAAQHAVLAAAEQRSDELNDELTRAHGLLSAATVRATQLQQELDTREAQSRAHENAALERRQALVASERAHAVAMRDLNAERERNAQCLEALQRAESRRLIFHSVLWDLQHEVDEREASLTRLGHELAGRDARARELDAEVKRRAVLPPAPAAAEPPAQAELERLQAERAELAAALGAARTEAAAERKRAGGLESELAGVRQEMADWGSVLQAAQRERGERSSSAAAGDARVRDLEQQLAQQQEALRALQTESDGSVLRTRELEADLHAAEDTINRLESQVRGSGTRLEELEKANRQWRLTMEELRAASTDTGAGNRALRAAAAQAVEPHAPNQSHDADDREPVAEGATRLLISKEQGRDIVHVLGRKTSVGRTPDNDLQIDAKFISRHHAVILAGPVHTVIEDLNSTNGVLVNGQRVGRQILKNGDEVVIGRSHYRFAVRRAGENR
jgi:chromosome segregation ATPase